MVTVLPPVESFGAAFGRALGGAVKSGAEGFSENRAEKAKIKRFNELMGAPQQQSQDIADLIGSLDIAPNAKRQLANMSPEDAAAVLQKLGVRSPETMGQQLQGDDPFKKAKAAMGAGLDKSYVDLFTKEGEIKAKQRGKESFAREQAGEKAIEEMEDRIQATELSDMRQERLQNLFSSSKEDQFPPALLAAAFTKDGELNPLAMTQLSTDAQEAVKLLADEVRGVKDTFGSQITGFEVRRWLARLPSLLNTPEGRRRVTNDLRMMNKFTLEADKGVLGIIDRYGGPSKISVGKAKSIYRKENAQKIKEMRKAFVNPESAEFSELPQASMFSGREIEDPETGQVFRSNGNEWIPL